MAESTGGETKSVIAICFITSYIVPLPKNSKYYNFTALFLCSKHLPVGPSHSLSLLHLFQVLPVWWPSCLIRSWPWPTWETRGVSSVIKTATLFPYHTTTNLTSWKNARGSRKPVRKPAGVLFSISHDADFLNSLVQHSAPKAAKGLRYLRCICSHIWQ